MKTLLHLLFALIFFSSCSKNIYSLNEKTIKFKYDGHLKIKLKPENYDKGNFYFDTGCTWLVFVDHYYEKQKMFFENTYDSEMGGVGNKTSKAIRISDTIHFEIDKHHFYSEFNIVTYFTQKITKNMDGIVGFHNFRGKPFKVDYVNKKITINPKIEDDYQEVFIEFDGYRMFLPLEIFFSNGHKVQGNFIIDTGSKNTTLTSQFIDNKNIKTLKIVNYESAGGIGGESDGSMFFVPQIKIDKYNLSDRLIDIAKDTLGALSTDEKYIGIVGNDILDDFDIIYHPTKHKIWMKPNKMFEDLTEDLFKGFSLVDTRNANEGWFVKEIYKESNAYKQGLRYNDEIVEINNKSVHKLNREKFISKLKPNQKLRIKVKHGNNYTEINTYLNVFLKK